MFNKFFNWLDDIIMGETRTFYEHKETGKLYFSWGTTDKVAIDDTEEREVVHLRPITVYVSEDNDKDRGFYWDFDSSSLYASKKFLKENFKKTNKLKKVKEL